jgi:putative FmdB family regulatory protein
MPIYEYSCGCGAHFEKLVRRFGEEVSCPSCRSADVEKQMSVFAVATQSAAPAFPGCGAGACGPGGGGCEAGPCGSGPCSLN